MENLISIMDWFRWNSSFTTYILLFIVWFIAFFWAWSIIWVAVDSHRRFNSFLAQIFSILLSIIPLFGFFMYLLIRPIRFKYDDNWWREALILNLLSCDDCWWLNTNDNNFCIYCWKNLKTECKECKLKYPSEWDYCNNCWAPNLHIEQKK